MYAETKGLYLKNNMNPDLEFSTKAVGWWWVFWIISNFLGQVVFRVTMNAETADELADSTLINMISNVVGVPLALITIKVISDYSKYDSQLAAIKGYDETDTLNIEPA